MTAQCSMQSGVRTQCVRNARKVKRQNPTKSGVADLFVQPNPAWRISWARRLPGVGKIATMALGVAAVAALTGLFESTRGNRKLCAATRAKLIKYFSTENERTVEELPMDVSSDGWELDWQAICSAADVADVYEARSVVEWIRATAVAGAKPGARSEAVLEVLKTNGVVVVPALQSQIEATLRVVGNAGDLRAQCALPTAVWAIYVGESPGVEAVTWLESKVSLLIGGKGNIDIRKWTGYTALLKASSCSALERVLLNKDPSNDELRRYTRAVEAELRCMDLPLCASEWQAVTGFAARQYCDDAAGERKYLWKYFFEYHLGRGLPEERCMPAELDLLRTTSVPTMKPSVRKEEVEHHLLTSTSGGAARRSERIRGSSRGWRRSKISPRNTCRPSHRRFVRRNRANAAVRRLTRPRTATISGRRKRRSPARSRRRRKSGARMQPPPPRRRAVTESAAAAPAQWC